MSSSEPFGPWVEAMERAGAVDPRNGRASWNQLAERAGVSTSAITNMVSGKTKAKPATVQKVAVALRVKPERVSEWIGATAPVGGPYVPVPEAALLSSREREALDLLIRAIARGREDVMGNAEHPAPIATHPSAAVSTSITPPALPTSPAGASPVPGERRRPTVRRGSVRRDGP